MTSDEIQLWTQAERLELADFLDDLEDHEWGVSSLCGDWTVHEVLAHVTLSNRVTLGQTLLGVLRARGDWNRMTADLARERAARFTPAELIAQLRESAGSTHRAPGAGPLDPLADIIIHGQDIARPLGRVREVPTKPGVAALDHIIGSRFYGARRRLRGLRLTAVEADWSAGDGPDEIRGPLSDLLLVSTGRVAGLSGLAGSGVARLTTTF
ncbi:maleylpyruvate isomerase family mycothiol-dependent enzyme [Nocardia sp. NPDC049526]|uniref:maleylpyruvate isomerase family mycothiol-dependent enzyme n=1 Tax=Nocardia sp. NPDC049526 TaxID=3364316 RepID=UPI00379F1B88